ncbi:MAG: type II toxin-antitoxin system prevent-host-death family antitoxin [Cyclobacteriaceae bacterium]|nr:type II toxin-antitoxin system prevent-host-death family antitoxin [Cyclobacteriaceae bacterium]
MNLKAFMDKVLTTRAPLYVTRSKGEDVVVLSKEEYESMMETFHLLSSPKNAERLLQAIKEDKEGKGTVRELLD